MTYTLAVISSPVLYEYPSSEITKEKNKKMPKFSEDYYRNTPKFSK